jgi:hypothetical protein
VGKRSQSRFLPEKNTETPGTGTFFADFAGKPGVLGKKEPVPFFLPEKNTGTLGTGTFFADFAGKARRFVGNCGKKEPVPFLHIYAVDCCG